MSGAKGRVKFKRRYVLAKGYPWALDVAPYIEVRMHDAPRGAVLVPLEWPAELWDVNLPKYRLVLERIP